METIRWDYSGLHQRLAVVELCLWVNKDGNATPTGKRIAKQSWDQMSSAARNILIRHGIEK